MGSLCAPAAPTHSFTSGGCSGFSTKLPVLTYETPAVMCQASSTVNPSVRVATAERTTARAMRATMASQVNPGSKCACSTLFEAEQLSGADMDTPRAAKSVSILRRLAQLLRRLSHNHGPPTRVPSHKMRGPPVLVSGNLYASQVVVAKRCGSDRS